MQNYLLEYYLLVIILNIETMNIVSSFAEEDDLSVMDWEEYTAETSNSEILCDFIDKAII